MSFSRRVIIVAAFAVVSFPARSAVDQVPTAAAEIATDRMSYTGAGAASCTHPLFVNPNIEAGDGPVSVAIGNLDGVNGPDLAVANFNSDDVSVLLSLCVVAEPCPADTNGDGFVNVLDLGQVIVCFGNPATPPCDTGQDITQDGFVNVNDLVEVLLNFGAACP